jgi:hypothetical protein
VGLINISLSPGFIMDSKISNEIFIVIKPRWRLVISNATKCSSKRSALEVVQYNALLTTKMHSPESQTSRFSRTARSWVNTTSVLYVHIWLVLLSRLTSVVTITVPRVGRHYWHGQALALLRARFVVRRRERAETELPRD